MVSVIKKDDRREDFDREKIRRGILEATKRANVAEDKANEIAEKIAARIEDETREASEIRSSEIRDKVLSALDAEEASIADEFRKFKKA